MQHTRVKVQRLRALYALGIVVALCAAWIPIAAADASPSLQLDQQVPMPASGPNSGGPANGAQWPAQLFTAGISGSLDQVDLPLLYVASPAGTYICQNNSTSFCAPGPGDLIVQIRTVNPLTGTPDAILGTVTVPEAQTRGWNGVAWRSIAFGANAAPVVAGARYAIVLMSSQLGGGYDVAAYAWVSIGAADPYPAGRFAVRGLDGQWHVLQGLDLIFQTYVTPAAAGTMPPGPPLATAISPSAAAAGAGSGLPLTVTGSNFAAGSTVVWSLNGAETVLPATLTSGQLLATIPAAALSAPGVGYVSVRSLGATSNALPFYITNTGTQVIGTASAFGIGGAVAKATAVTATASGGSGTVSVAQYAGSPTTTANTFNVNGVYYDVHLAAGNSFGSVTIQDCSAGSGQAYWYDPAQGWTLLENQSFDAASGCLTITVNTVAEEGGYENGIPVSSPSVAQLTGTYFSFPAPAVPAAPPVTTAQAAGRAGQNGWYTSPVTVTLAATDQGGPGVKQLTYSATGAQTIAATTTAGATAAVSITSQGTTTLSYDATDSAGNQEAAKTLAIKEDSIPPTTTAALAGKLGSNGWYTGPVTLTLAATDNQAGSGVASTRYSSDGGATWQPYTVPIPFAVDGQYTLQFRSTDLAGNVEGAKSVEVRIDQTPPTVTYSGNAGAYTVDQTVDITCAAADNLSGVASTTCANIAGPAASFPLRVNTISAAATDKAGNVGAGSATFTVQVTYASLCNLTGQYVTKQGIANSLCAKLDAAAGGDASHGPLNAYINEVNAQSGKALTADHAAVLVRLAQAL